MSTSNTKQQDCQQEQVERVRVVIRHAKDDFCQTAMVTDRGRPFAEQWVAEQQFEDGSEVWVVASEEQFPYNAPYTAETVGYFQTEIGDDLEHLLSIAKRGKSRGASGGERQARRIVKRLLDDVAGLDDSALNGIVELAELLRSDDGSDAEFVREAIK